MKTFVTILFALFTGCIAAVFPAGEHCSNVSAPECGSKITEVEQLVTSTFLHADAILSDVSPCKVQETSLRTKGGRNHIQKEHSTGNRGKMKIHIPNFSGTARAIFRHCTFIPNSVEKYILALERLII